MKTLLNPLPVNEQDKEGMEFFGKKPLPIPLQEVILETEAKI